MPVDHLTLYLNESTGLTGPALDRCKKREIKKRVDHFYFGGLCRGIRDEGQLGKNERDSGYFQEKVNWLWGIWDV